jgi:CRISPR-associated protein Cas5t
VSEVLWLRVKAPFAAFRPLQAGVFRGTVGTMPHSTAYGLVLNLAAIETRAKDVTETTLMKPASELPTLRIAIGEKREPDVGTLYQQLHSYPVGNASQHLAPGCHGAKYHIAPARREVLVGLDVVVAVQADPTVLHRVRNGLRGELNADRYGLPFAGDNNLLYDSIDCSSTAICARWYVPVDRLRGAQPRTTKLTLSIDRADSSKTRAGWFFPETEERASIPDAAWVSTPTV